MYFDGACQPKNPGGVASWGIVIVNPEDGRILHKEHGIVVDSTPTTNNLAEYSGCLMGVIKAKDLGVSRILIRGDSQLVINQIQDLWNCNSDTLRKYKEEIQGVLKNFENVVYQWIPREKNSVADSLTNEAYIEYCKQNDLKVQFFKRKEKRWIE